MVLSPYTLSLARCGIAGAVFLSAVQSPATAQGKAETFSGEYVVSFLGFPVARSTVTSRFENGKFSLENKVASAGLAQIFDSTRGNAVSSGGFSGDRTQPSSFRINYSEGKRKQMTAMKFSRGTVTDNQNVPPLKKRGKDWVPVKASHLKSVVDPLSAGVIKASSPAEVCGRTVKIFDGEFRLDAILKPAPPSTATAKEYGDNAVTCRVNVKPVAGYRKGRKALDYLEKRSKIVVTFAPLGTTGVYAPVYATIGTQLGTVTVKARRFEAKD